MNDPSAGPIVICSVLERDVGATLRAVEGAPDGCGLVEVRADHLRATEVRDVVLRAGRPLVVAIRTVSDGGRFDGSEEERRAALIAAFDGGARYVDVECDGAHSDLVSTERASRAVLSHHGANCEPGALVPLYERMERSAAARLKIVPVAASLAEAAAVRDLLRCTAREDRRLACFASGRAGAVTRLLGPAWGSWATYGAACEGAETADGQFAATDLLDPYDVLGVNVSSRLFGLVGSDIRRSASPAMHNAAHREAGANARYVPLECARFDDLLPLLDDDRGPRFDGLAVTLPFKREAARRSEPRDEISRASGAVNTVLLSSDRWLGYNTDGPAAVAAIRRHLEPDGLRVAIVGAGGAAVAVASALRGAGASVALFNRSARRAEAAARAVGAEAADLDRLAEARWDVLVNATPLGGPGEPRVPHGRLGGRLVLDAVYAAEETALARAARAAGIATIDGFELLVEQALGQYELMTGRRGSRCLFRKIGSAWLARGRDA